jgi:CheY-like chemotaxis protein/two-component sensor histidine kinase
MNKLLVVDDNQQNRYLAEVLFSKNGYQVAMAANGAEALELAYKKPPAVIITDVLMPVMDGFTLCRKWKMDERLKSIPFIFYTATYTDPEDEKFALNLGADRFIAKPVSPDVMLTAVREVLQESQTKTPSKSVFAEKESVYLKSYNQTLIHKLEQKVAQLEISNEALKNEIKERKQAEKEKSQLQNRLIQSHKMEAVGTLAGGIAHDFNNILMAIMGIVDIALIKLRIGQTVENHLHEVIDACDRAKELVRQILTYSRQSNIDRKKIQVKAIAKEALVMLRSSLPSNIEIRQNLASDSVILANATQIYQVLMNLCTNAAQALKESNGVITISLKDVEIKDTPAQSIENLPPGSYVLLQVSDSGVGMPADQLKRIFEPYFSTKKIGEGTGLGLSVVHGIVEDSGGQIRVRSTPGKGSTFSIYFPIIDGVAAPQKPVAEMTEGSQEHILLVDDEPDIVESGTELLIRLGYRVTAFVDSREALKAFQSQPTTFDLVITDMTMPGLTGDELAREVLRIRPDLPAILCTGFSDTITQEKADQLGINALLIKPFRLSELSKIIRKILDHDKSIPLTN